MYGEWLSSIKWSIYDLQRHSPGPLKYSGFHHIAFVEFTPIMDRFTADN